MARVALPVADLPEVRRYAKFLMRKHYGRLIEVVGLHGLAALAGLGAPLLFGRLIDQLRGGTSLATVDKIAIGLLAFALTRAVLTRFAALASTKLGELVLSELREDFVNRVLGIPLSTVERAGTGDLVTRTSRDVAALTAQRVVALHPVFAIGLQLSPHIVSVRTCASAVPASMTVSGGAAPQARRSQAKAAANAWEA
jgi:ABC-type multidrug transport system fused ATPase/permease subunit